MTSSSLTRKVRCRESRGAIPVEEAKAEPSAWEMLQRLRSSGFLDSIAEGYDVGGYVILATRRDNQVWQADGRGREPVAANLPTHLPLGPPGSGQ